MTSFSSEKWSEKQSGDSWMNSMEMRKAKLKVRLDEERKLNGAKRHLVLLLTDLPLASLGTPLLVAGWPGCPVPSRREALHPRAVRGLPGER